MAGLELRRKKRLRRVIANPTLLVQSRKVPMAVRLNPVLVRRTIKTSLQRRQPLRPLHPLRRLLSQQVVARRRQI